MRTVAASFSTLPAAEGALAALGAAFDLAPGQVKLALLGHTTYPADPDRIMAGRFEDADVIAVREIVERFGGTIVTDVDASSS